MLTIHTITRIIATGTDNLRFIWSDGYEETHPADWTGFYRGSVGGHGPDGEYERQDGTPWLNAQSVVLDCFIANGGAVEPYVPPEPEEGNE